MRVRLIPIAILAAAFFLASNASGPSPAAADGYTLSPPITHENLTIFPIHGASTTAPTPLTLDEAASQGLVRIHEAGNGEPTIDNLSNQSLFVQFGDLVKGGLQDQVSATSQLIAPGAMGVPLTVFCVERGRSTERVGDDKSAFVTANTMLPSRLAKLTILTGTARTSLADKVRQIGLWLSVASAQDGLSAKVGTQIQSSRSDTSLPLSLADNRLSKFEAPAMHRFHAIGESKSDTVGAVFAINGRLSSVEIYSSNALFKKMWPKLLRAYVTEATALKGKRSPAPPTRKSATAFLADAMATLPGNETSTQFATVENQQGISTVLKQSDGDWVHQNYLAKGDLNSTPLERAVLTTLANNHLGNADLSVVRDDRTWIAMQRMNLDPLNHMTREQLLALRLAAASESSWLARQQMIVGALTQMTDDRNSAFQQALRAGLAVPLAPTATAVSATSGNAEPLPGLSSIVRLEQTPSVSLAQRNAWLSIAVLIAVSLAVLLVIATRLPARRVLFVSKKSPVATRPVAAKVSTNAAGFIRRYWDRISIAAIEIAGELHHALIAVLRPCLAMRGEMMIAAPINARG